MQNNSNVEAKDVIVKVQNDQQGVSSLEKTDETEKNVISSKFKEINKNSPQLISHKYLTNQNFKKPKLEFDIIVTTENNIKYGFTKKIQHPVNLKLSLRDRLQ